MKKILLSASMLMLSAAAFAVTDGATYETINGLTCENLWVFDEQHTGDAFKASALFDGATAGSGVGRSARTATTDGKIIYIGHSAETAVLERFDINTGEMLEPLALKLDGAAYAGTLAANQVGFDEYGHLYVASYDATTDRTDVSYKVYIVNQETGDLTSVGFLDFDKGKDRIDYCDVIGDLTGVEANCSILAVGSGDGSSKECYWWYLPQGETEWEGGWEGDFWIKIDETYPADQTQFSYGSMAKMVRDGSATGDLNLFYIDGFTTLPALYQNDGSMLDNIGNASFMGGEDVKSGVYPVPSSGTNGLTEAAVGDQKLFIYSLCQANDGEFGARAVIASIDADMTLESLVPMWKIPGGEKGLGETSDLGNRIHCLDRVVLPEDENGKSAMLLVTFKCYAGLGVYRIAEEGYNPQGSVEENFVANADIRVNGDVIAVSETAESIEVYNVAGQKVAQVENASEIAAPATGLYIVKAVVEGAPVVKKVIVK
ncbi:MAG TPA: T9SS type A sorting domain-containing protein [Candidatus Limisoma gallistercoris]|nr:T9SS type A sorting domain-containing protein [Candidatus Limisoma gallistercoris]